jgi:hypothetical protein
MIVIGLVLGFLAAPATSSAVELFHRPTPTSEFVSLPLRVPQSNPPNLNLWIDPDVPSDDTTYAFDMDVKPSGSLTYSFQRVEAEYASEDPNGVLGISGASQDGWPAAFHVGTFDINSDGGVGDEIRLLGGHYTPSSWVEQLFTPETLAVVGGCGDGIEDFGEQCDPPFDTCSVEEPCNEDTCQCGGEPPDSDEQKCANTANKNAAKVAKAQAADNAKCIKDGGNNKLTGTIEECITSDLKGKVGKAAAKLNQKVSTDCQGIALVIPPISTSDPDALGQIMIDKELALIHAIFGDDLDAVVVMKDDNKDGWKCQSAIAKAVGKCQDAKLAVFNSCKKNKLKGKNMQQAGSTTALQDECMGTGSSGIPDPKGKIAKKCGGDFDIGKNCGGQNLDVMIPGCVPGADAACVDRKIECEVCKTLNALDGLDRCCDQFDNGLVDGSCEGGTCE